jgi:hypothetical protein
MQRFRVRFPALQGFLTNSGGLDRGPLSFVTINEELLERESSGCCVELTSITGPALT